MKPIAIIGMVLIVLGAIVVAMQGVSYVRDRHEVSMGPIQVAAEERGFIPPVVGVVALVAGVAVVLIGRRRI
jgi:Na+-transporting methylmalonyl-CoA/oxaloacetate decarboxylase gamma subunit